MATTDTTVTTPDPAPVAPKPKPERKPAQPKPASAILQPFGIDLGPALGTLILELNPTRLTVNGTTLKFDAAGM